MRIGIITIEDVHDKKAWSGIVYNIYHELCYRYGKENVVHISTRKTILERLYMFIQRIIAKLCRRQASLMNNFVAKQRASTMKNCINADIDFLFAPAGSVDIAFLQSKIPIIYYSDATFKSMCSYYPNYDKISSNKQKEAISLEIKALNNSTICMFASHWAMNSAINNYHIPTEKTLLMEFGANIMDSDITYTKREGLLQKIQIGETINILFIGVDWERKGGQVAVDCVRCLNRDGYKSVLHVVGIKNMPKEVDDYIVENHGFLNKNKKEDYDVIVNLLKTCDLFLLPTRAECAGIVFAEASAFGLPIFTYDTGGVSDYVINGKNGYRLSLNSTGKDFACMIETVITRNKSGMLSEGGRNLYLDRLNWRCWGDRFNQLITNMR